MAGLAGTTWTLENTQGRKSPKRSFILRGIYSCIYLCMCVYVCVCMCIQWSVYMYVFVYVEVSVCTCTWWCVYLCVVCMCGTCICIRTCIHPFQMNPQEDSPNSLGVFSWAPLDRNSIRQQFCSQTWVAGSRWPFDVCWAPLVLTWRCAWAGQGTLEVSVRLSGSSLALLGKPPLHRPEDRWCRSRCGSLKQFLCQEVFMTRGIHDSLGKDVLWTQSTQAWGRAASEQLWAGVWGRVEPR